jgi:hypothetical protein
MRYVAQPSVKFLDQTGLADPRLADDQHQLPIALGVPDHSRRLPSQGNLGASRREGYHEVDHHHARALEWRRFLQRSERKCAGLPKRPIRAWAMHGGPPQTANELRQASRTELPKRQEGNGTLYTVTATGLDPTRSGSGPRTAVMLSDGGPPF